MRAYKNIKKDKYDSLSITEKMAKGIFSLPLYPKLSETSALKIAKSLRKVLKQI